MTYFGSQLNIKFSSWVVSFSISFKIWTASSTLCKFRLSFLNDKSQNWRNETSRRGQALLSFEKKIKISSVSGRDDVPMVLRPSAVTNTVDAAKALEAVCSSVSYLHWNLSNLVLKGIIEESCQRLWQIPRAVHSSACPDQTRLRIEVWVLVLQKIRLIEGVLQKRANNIRLIADENRSLRKELT